MTHAASVTETDVWRDPRTVALLLAATLIIMANATISPALPGLESAFADHPDAELLTRLLVPAPSLTVLLFAPVAGFVVDRFGRRWPMLIGVLAFAITGTAGLVLNDLTAIFVSRLALGIAVAVIMTAQTALIGDYFTGNQRTHVAGLQVSARNFGGFVIITLAGWLAALSPVLPFAIYGLAALYLPVMWAALPEPKRPPRTVGSDDRTTTEGLSSWPVWLAALSSLQFLTNLTFFLVPTQLPFFVGSVGHSSVSMTGLALGVLMLAGGCTALLYSRLKDEVGHTGVLALGYGLMAAGFAGLPSGVSAMVLLISTSAIGAGFALAMPNFVDIALQIAPGRHRGLAAGALTSAVFLGQFVSPFVSLPSISSFGFDATFHGTAVMLGALAVIAAGVRGAKKYRLLRSV